MLGIGVITYNRQTLLWELLERIAELTGQEFHLVIADDGSTDGTPQALRENHWRCVTGKNRGCAWNKNRALYWLLNETEADPILLLEDDCHPIKLGWELDWIKAAWWWEHVNAICYGIGPEVTGENTPEFPWRCFAYAGVCTITMRTALESVGYLDTRFVGYGYEHVEWTSRFCREFGEQWGPPEGGVPCLWRGLEMKSVTSYYDREQLMRNQRLWPVLCHDPVYRDPWRSEDERLAFLAEIEEAPRE